MFTLNINQIKLSVYLGVFPEEQLEKQMVTVFVRLKSNKFLEACHSDDLSDTICYATLADRLQVVCDHKRYQLVEHLAYRLYQAVQSQVGDGFEVSIKVRKQAPVGHIDDCEVEIGG